MRNYPSIGIQVPDILLPKEGIDLSKWAVIACDQFTSQPNYWKQVENIVGNLPSTYNLILPEAFLGKPEENEHVKRTAIFMQKYITDGTLVQREGIVYIERTINEKVRRGLLLALDLEQYDYNKGSVSLIRSTEGTILERLPPRIRIREKATIELPHILVLIDDRENEVFDPLIQGKNKLAEIYNFELMLGSGQLRGYLVNDNKIEKQIIQAFNDLANPEIFDRKYCVNKDTPILLFAVGDGNHSLATAKAVWEKMKPITGMSHPSRYALVEIVNIHDEGLDFEPIHRLLFNVRTDILINLHDYFWDNFEYKKYDKADDVTREVKNQKPRLHKIGLFQKAGQGIIQIKNQNTNLAVRTLQPFLDNLLQERKADNIDYLHGDEILLKLSKQDRNIGFFLPTIEKKDLFKTVILEGSLPRKTFSMGEAKGKRFYLECRNNK
ncbi:MAG TPA: DUF1015 domain-containing protein [Anaerolineae bacterium]|nr:DUF1015 domain-containing protein [Anaerolineae bacterium]